MIRGPAAVALLLLCGGGAAAQTASSCVDVRIGDEQYYDCLNRRLAETTQTGKAFTAADAPLGVNSPPVALGQYNQAAVRERLGTSYGRSLVPQRPARIFTNPLVR